MPFTLGSEIFSGIVRANKVVADTTVELPTDTSIGTVTSTELGHLSGVTSSIQTQLSGKQPLGSYQTALETPVVATPSGTGNLTLTSNTGYNSLLTFTPPYVVPRYFISMRLAHDGSNILAINSNTITELTNWEFQYASVSSSDRIEYGIITTHISNNNTDWTCPATGVYHMILDAQIFGGGSADNLFRAWIYLQKWNGNSWGHSADCGFDASPSTGVNQDDDFVYFNPVLSHYVFCEQNDKFRFAVLGAMRNGTQAWLQKAEKTHWQIVRVS